LHRERQVVHGEFDYPSGGLPSIARSDARLTPYDQLTEAVRAYWDAYPHGAEYGNQAGLEPGTPAFFQHISPWMATHKLPWVMARIEREAARLRGKHLLDVGCGLGYDSVEFLRRGVRVTATDISPASVQLARRHFVIAGVRPEAVEVTNALALPYADRTFDAVWANGVLYYTGDTPGALQEIWRVLRPGGRAIISHFRRRPSWIDVLARYARERIEFKDEEPPVTDSYTESEILAMFRPFRVVETARDHYRALPITRSGWKGRLYTWGFRPVFNAIPRPLAERWASKFSVTAVKPEDGVGRQPRAA
jgi:ubiquinone/menaquinone biosynthesis C-methylase UbiE